MICRRRQLWRDRTSVLAVWRCSGTSLRRPSRATSSGNRLGFDPEEALEVVGEVGELDLGPGPGQADGAHEQAEAVLLAGEHRPDGRADLGAGPVGLALRRRQIEARLSPEVDFRAPALLGQMGFVGLGAVGGVSPDVARRIAGSRTLASCAPSWAAALVTVKRWTKPCLRSIEMGIL